MTTGLIRWPRDQLGKQLRGWGPSVDLGLLGIYWVIPGTSTGCLFQSPVIDKDIRRSNLARRCVYLNLRSGFHQKERDVVTGLQFCSTVGFLIKLKALPEATLRTAKGKRHLTQIQLSLLGQGQLSVQAHCAGPIRKVCTSKRKPYQRLLIEGKQQIMETQRGIIGAQHSKRLKFCCNKKGWRFIRLQKQTYPHLLFVTSGPGSSRMMGNYHVRFLGEGAEITSRLPYPTSYKEDSRMGKHTKSLRVLTSKMQKSNDILEKGKFMKFSKAVYLKKLRKAQYSERHLNLLKMNRASLYILDGQGLRYQVYQDCLCVIY
eukprot:TRINITY_DN2381_c0_g1_i4.p1 TRINITY_DN2381_c0_g1~~TRINITY_DN2381_c0_g1_i4.p1  ORF type:complete len:317 (-),score=-14.63 TRINITY_DN2381_c0_g1_i4:189-1139(-)